jgi:hypothetical protein
MCMPAQLLAPVLTESCAAGQAAQVWIIGRHKHYALILQRIYHDLKKSNCLRPNLKGQFPEKVDEIKPWGTGISLGPN